MSSFFCLFHERCCSATEFSVMSITRPLRLLFLFMLNNLGDPFTIGGIQAFRPVAPPLSCLCNEDCLIVVVWIEIGPSGCEGGSEGRGGKMFHTIAAIVTCSCAIRCKTVLDSLNYTQIIMYITDITIYGRHAALRVLCA